MAKISLTQVPSDRGGIIHISYEMLSHLAPDISVDNLTTQGQLRDRGDFDLLRQRLLLPEHYIVQSVIYDLYHRYWNVLVESPDLPVTNEGVDFPLVEPVYCRVNGEPRLVEIKINVARVRFHSGNICESCSNSSEIGSIEWNN